MVALKRSVLFGFGEFSKTMNQTFAEANMSIEFRKNVRKLGYSLLDGLDSHTHTHLAINHYRSLQSVPAGHPSRTLFLQVLSSHDRMSNHPTLLKWRAQPQRGCRYQLDITWTMMVFNPGHFFIQVVNKKVPVLFQDYFINNDFFRIPFYPHLSTFPIWCHETISASLQGTGNWYRIAWRPRSLGSCSSHRGGPVSGSKNVWNRKIPCGWMLWDVERGNFGETKAKLCLFQVVVNLRRKVNNCYQDYMPRIGTTHNSIKNPTKIQFDSRCIANPGTSFKLLVLNPELKETTL